MKLVALKKVWYRNTTRGRMEALKIGQEFSLDVRKDAEQIFTLISNLQAVPIDPEFIPANGRYLALHSFSYQDSEGRTVEVAPRQVVKLDRKQACEFMVKALVRPVDVNQWSPSELLKPKNIPTGGAKKMFDEVFEPRNWVKGKIARDL